MLAAEGGEEELTGEATLGVVVLADRRQPRRGGGRDVVEADDGEVGRDSDARRRGGVQDAERIGEVRVADQADRTGAAAPQAARERIGARVAEPSGGFEDPLAQGGRELVGAVEGVGDRHGGHADLLGEALQRDPALVGHRGIFLDILGGPRR